MQSPFPQDMDFTAQLDVLNEYIPVIDQIIDTNLSVDFYQKNRNLASLILQKCLAELKELKGTVASQEDVLQRATEELINLREENSHLNETNNNLINQVSNLKIFLNEADLIACSLRSELNQLKHENHILTDHYKRFDSSNEVNSYMQIDQIVPEKEQSLNGILVDKDLEESLLSEVLQQKEDTIKCLTQNIQDLSEYKEKYLKIQQENESYKTLEEQNKKLIEELLILQEDNKKLLNKSSAEIFKRLKPLECHQNPEKGTTLQSEDEIVQNFSSITDEGCRNKNYLALKSFTIASPSKENVDIKKSNLLMETILLSSANRSKTPLMKRSNDRSKKQISSSQTLKKIQGLNLGSVLKKNNGRTTENALIEGSSKETEHKTEEFEIKQPKIDKESCSSLHVFADNKSSQRDRLNYSARKFEERANCQESPFDGNTSKASDEHCFDEMLSWEEGDFPRLNCSSLICHSPKMEYNLNTYQDTLKQLESQVIKDDDGRNQKLDSMTPGESQKILEKIKNGQKNFQSEMLKSTRIQSMFKENATQTDFIENQSIKGINDIKLKLATPNRSKIISNGFVLLVSLLFSLIIISFFTKRIDKIETSL